MRTSPSRAAWSCAISALSLARNSFSLTICCRSRNSLSGACPRSRTLSELVLQVHVALGERVAWDLGLLGQSDDRQGAVGVGSGPRPGCGPWRRGCGRVRSGRGSWGALRRGDAGAVVFVGGPSEPVGVVAQAVADGIGQTVSPLLQDGGPLAKMFGVVVGACDVRAGGHAAVQAGTVVVRVAATEGSAPHDANYPSQGLAPAPVGPSSAGRSRLASFAPWSPMNGESVVTGRCSWPVWATTALNGKWSGPLRVPGPGSVEPDDESYIVHAVEFAECSHHPPDGSPVGFVSCDPVVALRAGAACLLPVSGGEL